jgi:hypothetical protein
MAFLTSKENTKAALLLMIFTLTIPIKKRIIYGNFNLITFHGDKFGGAISMTSSTSTGLHTVCRFVVLMILALVVILSLGLTNKNQKTIC